MIERIFGAGRRVRMRGLVVKFTLLFGLLLGFFAAGETFLSSLAHKQIIYDQLRHRAEAVVTVLARALSSSVLDLEHDPERLGDLLSDIVRQDDLLRLQVLDGDGSVIAASSAEGRYAFDLADERLTREVRAGSDKLWHIGHGKLRIALPIEIEPGRRGAVILVLSLSKYERDLVESRRESLLAAAGFLAISILLTFLLVRQITRPLAQLIASSNAIAEGRTAERIGIRTRDELEHLASAFNRMLDRLEATTVTRDYLNQILQSMSEALVVLTPDRRIVLANRALTNLLGYDEEELEGVIFDRLLPAPSTSIEARPTDPIGQLHRRGRLDQVETYFVDRLGWPVAIRLSGALLSRSGDDQPAMICIAQDDRERRRQQEQVNRLAYFDSVTGLPNRVYFQRLLEQAIAASAQRHRPGAVLFIDLDHFKRVNDTLGHAAGDILLGRFANRTSSILRETDNLARLSPDDGPVLARLGGDEFTVILNDLHDRSDAERVAARILDSLAQPFELDGSEVVVNGSIGIAIFPDDGTDPTSLLMHADTAMYHAKACGRGNYQSFDTQLNERVRERLALENDLRRALEKGMLELHYQPQLDIASNRVVGVEALVRWPHPERGFIRPDIFIPIAEEAGIIGELGAWVLETSCRQMREWAAAGQPGLRIAVNISGRQFWHAEFTPQVLDALQSTGLPASQLELEITESIAMQDPDAVSSTLAQLRERGVTVSIDDFGTGYSSLSYMKHFPIDRLKIDRSFVRDLATDPQDRVIVRTIVMMAHQLGAQVIAEGVEDDGQFELLREYGCDEIQGYLLCKPVAATDFIEWLRAREAV